MKMYKNLHIIFIILLDLFEQKKIAYGRIYIYTHYKYCIYMHIRHFNLRLISSKLIIIIKEYLKLKFGNQNLPHGICGLQGCY